MDDFLLFLQSFDENNCQFWTTSDCFGKFLVSGEVCYRQSCSINQMCCRLIAASVIVLTSPKCMQFPFINIINIK